MLGRALYFVSALYPENLSALSHKLNEAPYVIHIEFNCHMVNLESPTTLLLFLHAAANVIVNVNQPQVHLACMRVVAR